MYHGWKKNHGWVRYFILPICFSIHKILRLHKVELMKLDFGNIVNYQETVSKGTVYVLHGILNTNDPVWQRLIVEYENLKQCTNYTFCGFFYSYQEIS